MKHILGAVMICIMSYVDGHGGGSMYIRWGRTSCEQGSSLVYAGYAGGSSYQNSGGGSNYLCLTPKPIFRVNAPSTNRAYVYGAEYQYPPTPAKHDYEVPCALCESPSCAVFMQPGSDECPSGWVTEYSGWLAAAYHTGNHVRTEFVCVDHYAENGNSSTDLNGALFYPAQTMCGSLPCGPYENARDLTCAVCSK